jgi:hypothetical protein
MPVGKWVGVGFIAITAACNTIVGNDIGHLGDGDAAVGDAAVGDAPEPPVADGDGGDSGTLSSDGGDSGTLSSDGGGSGCGVDGAVDDDGAVDAAAGTTCGFTMPNPASAGLPNAASYTENVVDGTITDNVTGLTWEGTVEQNAEYTQGQAVRHCEDAGGGWRLPTRLELVSLVDFTIAKPGPTINPVFKNTPAQKYWTSSHFACIPTQAYYVDFAYGSAHPVTTDSTYWVRCVRGAPSRCSPTHYGVQADGSVQDTVTGLTWQRNADTTPKLTWSAAMTFCPTLGMGWRLPSPAELETIVDETKQSPPIDVGAFPNTPSSFFWTSLPQVGNAGFAWYVAFIHGHLDTDLIDTPYFVRCVR